jgi:WhiB family redox-sensing transcriptional regulator
MESLSEEFHEQEAPVASREAALSIGNLALTGDVRYDWKLLGVCRGSDPTLFFPAEQSVSQEVKEMCKRCPVTEPCLEFAITHKEPGFWAGTTEGRRSKIRRQRALASQSLQS